MRHVMKSHNCREKIKAGQTKLFSNLKKHQIIDELHQRGLKFFMDSPKNVLEDKLKTEMHGIQRFPSLMQVEPGMISEIPNYEILPCEPLHDIKNHIDNLYNELPHHLPKNDKKVMQDVITASFDKKDCKRGVDYRKSLVKISIALRDNIDRTVQKILFTLCDVQQILYAPESERTIENILRLYNQTFLHAILLKEMVVNTKHLTSRVLWGKYFHAFFSHAPVMYRILSGRSANAEQEERIFHVFKLITNSTSNHHPDHVIDNVMIRLAVRDEVNDVYRQLEQQTSQVNQLSECLPDRQNTTISFWIIDKYRMAWQKHLERIADFLYEKCWWVENDDGIMFLDARKNDKTAYKPHHFRSSDMKKEINYVSLFWEKCLEEQNIIPAREIMIKGKRHTLNNIAFFKEDL